MHRYPFTNSIWRQHDTGTPYPSLSVSESTEVVVIGAGIVGLVCADELQKRWNASGILSVVIPRSYHLRRASLCGTNVRKRTRSLCGDWLFEIGDDERNRCRDLARGPTHRSSEPIRWAGLTAPSNG